MLRVIWSLFKILVVVGVLAALGAGFYVWRAADRKYAAYELVYHARLHRYDHQIQEVAKKRGVDPMVVKAIVWTESRFSPDKTGVDGERGLMQITDKAAEEWVKGEKVPDFVPTDLYDPKVNLDAGTWLLARNLRRYEGKDDPLPFALAEYNAGRSRVVKWTGERDGNEAAVPVSSQELMSKINIPSTKRYIETVQDRVKYYRQQGQL